MIQVTRKAVPLDGELLAAVNEVRVPGSALNEALVRRLGRAPGASEAAVLAALVRLGVDVLRAEVVDAGYASLAIELAGDAGHAQARDAALRARRDREARRAEAGI